MRNFLLILFATVSLPAGAPAFMPMLACATRVELAGFRPVLGAAEEGRVLGYRYEMRNLSDAALLVQPSFVAPFGSPPVLGTPVMLRPGGAAVTTLPLEATLLAGQHGLDLAAVMRATRASCSIG